MADLAHRHALRFHPEHLGAIHHEFFAPANTPRAPRTLQSRNRPLRQPKCALAGQKADVVVYTISPNISRIETDGDKILRYFTAETGGTSFFPFKVEDLSQSFENIANELRHQYNIAYRPEPLLTDGLFHPVDMRVKGRKDLVVRVRNGYYAPKM